MEGVNNGQGKEGDGQKNVLEEQRRGWRGQINSGKQGIYYGMDPGKSRSFPGPVCNDSQEQQPRRMGSGAVGGGDQKQEPAWGLTSLGMKDDPSVTRDQKAMPPHIRYFRLYLSPR